MKYFLSFILLVVSISSSFGQNLQPVSWSSEVRSVSDDVYEIVVTATMEEGWVIYSQFTNPDGPIPTEFEIENDEIELIDGFQEITKSKKGMSEMFGVEVIKFSEEAVFVQKFKSKGAKNIKGNVTFMTCDNLRCLPPTTIEFSSEL